MLDRSLRLSVVECRFRSFCEALSLLLNRISHDLPYIQDTSSGAIKLEDSFDKAAVRFRIHFRVLRDT